MELLYFSKFWSHPYTFFVLIFSVLLQADIEAMQAELQAEIHRLQSENRIRFDAQREASEKSVKISARVMALNSKNVKLAAQLKESQAREAALKSELISARQAPANNSGRQNIAVQKLPPVSRPELNGIANGKLYSLLI